MFWQMLTNLDHILALHILQSVHGLHTYNPHKDTSVNLVYLLSSFSIKGNITSYLSSDGGTNLYKALLCGK